MPEGAPAAGRSGWPRQVLTTVLVVAALVGVSVIGVRWVQDREHDRRCRHLSAPVEGIDAIDWDNGVTSSDAVWLTALTDGVEHADAPTRAALAVALREDVDGYRHARDALPESDREAVVRLREVLIEPEGPIARRADDDVQRDIVAVRTAGARCGLV